MNPNAVANEVISNLYTGASERDVHQALISRRAPTSSASLLTTFVAARLLLNQLYSEALGEPVTFCNTEMV